MKIEARVGMDRDDHFYAIKDLGTNRYVSATWEQPGMGNEECVWLGLMDKLSMVSPATRSVPARGSTR